MPLTLGGCRSEVHETGGGAEGLGAPAQDMDGVKPSYPET